MREIVLDTETTGLNANESDRLVEIGCVELDNHLPTGRTYHQYINPERDMPEEALAIHGLSETFLSTHPVFADIADDFLVFVDDANLVIHNAKFDLGFINAELRRLGRPHLEERRAIDTLQIARSKFPGAQASLDALCRRFEIDLTARTKHGALLDAELLANVYLELVGGRQPGLGLVKQNDKEAKEVVAVRTVPPRPIRPHAESDSELSVHDEFIEKLTNPIWRQ